MIMVELPCTVNNSDIIFELKTVPFKWMLLKIGIPQDHLFLCLYRIYETTIVGYVQIIFNHVHMGMDQYLLIPFTSYFDVHQGYKVLTHPYVNIM